MPIYHPFFTGLLSGDLGRIGKMWIINLRLIDVDKVVVLKRTTHQVSGNIDKVVKILPAAVAELFRLPENIQKDLKVAQKFIKRKLKEKVICNIAKKEEQKWLNNYLQGLNQLAKKGEVTKRVEKAIECIHENPKYRYIVGVENNRVISFWGAADYQLPKLKL